MALLYLVCEFAQECVSIIIHSPAPVNRTSDKKTAPETFENGICVAAVYRRRDWIVYRFGFVQVNSTQAEPITLAPLPDALTRILIVL